MPAGLMVVVPPTRKIRRTVMPEVRDRVACRWSRLTGRENRCYVHSYLRHLATGICDRCRAAGCCLCQRAGDGRHELGEPACGRTVVTGNMFYRDASDRRVARLPDAGATPLHRYELQHAMVYDTQCWVSQAAVQLSRPIRLPLAPRIQMCEMLGRQSTDRSSTPTACNASPFAACGGHTDRWQHVESAKRDPKG